MASVKLSSGLFDNSLYFVSDPDRGLSIIKRGFALLCSPTLISYQEFTEYLACLSHGYSESKGMWGFLFPTRIKSSENKIQDFQLIDKFFKHQTDMKLFPKKITPGWRMISLIVLAPEVDARTLAALAVLKIRGIISCLSVGRNAQQSEIQAALDFLTPHSGNTIFESIKSSCVGFEQCNDIDLICGARNSVFSDEGEKKVLKNFNDLVQPFEMPTVDSNVDFTSLTR